MENKNGGKDKTQMKKARIFEEQPNSIASDGGSKFLNEVFSVFLELKDIKRCSRYSLTAAVCDEILIGLSRPLLKSMFLKKD